MWNIKERPTTVQIIKRYRINGDGIEIRLEKQSLGKQIFWSLFENEVKLGQYKTQSAGIDAWFATCQQKESTGNAGYQQPLLLRQS